MAQYKLNYFNGRGKAEPIRLLFAAAGQKYEDVRFERETWPQYKPKSPTGQAPFIEINEGGNSRVLAESVTILRYLAKKFGLAGKSDFEIAEVEMAGDKTSDLLDAMLKSHYEKDENKKKELQQKFVTETLPPALKFFDERIGKSGSGFIAASGLTWADLYLVNTLDWLADKKEAALENFANLKAQEKKVKSLPKVAEWLEKRPKTEF